MKKVFESPELRVMEYQNVVAMTTSEVKPPELGEEEL